jgi:hypothetical protein
VPLDVPFDVPLAAADPLLQPARIAPAAAANKNALQTLTVDAMSTFPDFVKCESGCGGLQQRTEFTSNGTCAITGNPAICGPQTGSFAPPSHDGFALSSA